MHDDELGYEVFANIFEESNFAVVFHVGQRLGYEVFANIFEESNFAVVFHVGQRTCLVGFMFCL